jgi:hypothetical protein
MADDDLQLLLKEIRAAIYSVIVGRVRTDGYFRPTYLHADVFAAFQEVIPWPQTP